MFRVFPDNPTPRKIDINYRIHRPSSKETMASSGNSNRARKHRLPHFAIPDKYPPVHAGTKKVGEHESQLVPFNVLTFSRSPAHWSAQPPTFSVPISFLNRFSASSRCSEGDFEDPEFYRARHQKWRDRREMQLTSSWAWTSFTAVKYWTKSGGDAIGLNSNSSY